MQGNELIVFAKDSGTCLDHVYVNFNPTDVQLTVIDAYFSDHDIVSVVIPLAKMHVGLC